MSPKCFKRKLIFLLMLWCCVSPIRSQQKLPEFKIVEFYLDPQDGAARSREYGKEDSNGSLMAIIKLKPTDSSVRIDDPKAFKFNFGNMNHDVKVHDDEIWIYVQKGAKTVTIKRDGYATISKFDLGGAIKEGCTYVMKITFNKVIYSTVHTLNKQILQFQLEPALPNVLITLRHEGSDDAPEMLTTDETGCTAQNLEFGTYIYEINADKYLPSSGRIKLTTSDSNYVERVKLTPNFGYLAIEDPDNAAGAKIFVNGKDVEGTVPYNEKVEWDCGENYRLQLVKDLYKPYTTTFAIRRGETTVLRPHLESNFAETTLTVDGGAEIWIDDERKGAGRWAGPLKAGTYLVECKKANHRPTTKEITVEADVASTVTLDPPVPITGFISVLSTPTGADISIDGKPYGQTPQIIKGVLIGHHRVELSMHNRKTETRDVNVEEGNETKIEVELSTLGNISFRSTPNADIYIDGKHVDCTPFEREMSSGEYDVRAVRSGYKDFHQKIYIDVSKPEVSLRLTKQLMKPNMFYAEVTGAFGSTTAVGGTMGFYAGGINVEGWCMAGLGGGETIFWVYSGEGSSEAATRPYEEELKVKMYAGGKVGYGFIFGTRMRLTPQIGVGYVGIGGDESSTYALTGVAGLRLEYALTPWLGVSLSPEVSFRLSEPDNLKALSEVSSKIKGWGNGFNARLGLFLYL